MRKALILDTTNGVIKQSPYQFFETGDLAISLGSQASGNRETDINFYSDTVYAPSFQIARLNNAGSDSNTMLKHRGNGDFQIYAEEAAAIVLYSFGVERFRVNNNGNIGINKSDPDKLLHILGDGVAGDGTSDVKITGIETVGAGLTLNPIATGGRDYSIIATANGAGVGGGFFGIFDITAAAYRLVIDSGGNTGIGATVPAALLHIHSAGTATILRLSAFAPGIEFQNNQVTASRTMAALIGLGTAAGHYSGGAGDLNIGTFSLAAGNSNAIRFVTASNNSGSYAERMKITATSVTTTVPIFPNGFSSAYSGNSLSLVNNGVASIGLSSQANFAFVFIHAGGAPAIYSLNGGNHTVNKISDPSAVYSTAAGTASQMNIYWSVANSRYEIENKRGSTLNARLWILEAA